MSAMTDAAADAPLLSGALWKRASRPRLLSSRPMWRKQQVCLRADCLLYTHPLSSSAHAAWLRQEPSQEQQDKHRMPLQGVYIAQHNSTTFSIASPQRRWTFLAENEEDAEKWVKAVRSAIRHVNGGDNEGDESFPRTPMNSREFVTDCGSGSALIDDMRVALRLSSSHSFSLESSIMSEDEDLDEFICAIGSFCERVDEHQRTIVLTVEGEERESSGATVATSKEQQALLTEVTNLEKYGRQNELDMEGIRRKGAAIGTAEQDDLSFGSKRQEENEATIPVPSPVFKSSSREVDEAEGKRDDLAMQIEPTTFHDCFPDNKNERDISTDREANATATIQKKCTVISIESQLMINELNEKFQEREQIDPIKERIAQSITGVRERNSEEQIDEGQNLNQKQYFDGEQTNPAKSTSLHEVLMKELEERRKRIIGEEQAERESLEKPEVKEIDLQSKNVALSAEISPQNVMDCDVNAYKPSAVLLSNTPSIVNELKQKFHDQGVEDSVIEQQMQFDQRIEQVSYDADEPEHALQLEKYETKGAAVVEQALQPVLALLEGYLQRSNLMDCEATKETGAGARLQRTVLEDYVMNEAADAEQPIATMVAQEMQRHAAVVDEGIGVDSATYPQVASMLKQTLQLQAIEDFEEVDATGVGREAMRYQEAAMMPQDYETKETTVAEEVLQPVVAMVEQELLQQAYQKDVKAEEAGVELQTMQRHGVGEDEGIGVDATMHPEEAAMLKQSLQRQAIEDFEEVDTDVGQALPGQSLDNNRQMERSSDLSQYLSAGNYCREVPSTVLCPGAVKGSTSSPHGDADVWNTNLHAPSTPLTGHWLERYDADANNGEISSAEERAEAGDDERGVHVSPSRSQQPLQLTLWNTGYLLLHVTAYFSVVVPWRLVSSAMSFSLYLLWRPSRQD